MSVEPAIPQNVREALITEVFGEILAARKDVEKFRDDLSLRAGICQEYLESANETLKKYQAAANAHFTATKGELKDVASTELRESITQSLVDAHQRVAINRPKLGVSGLLIIALTSALVAGIIGIGSGYLAYQFQNQADAKYVQNGKELEAVWPSLKKTTKDDLYAVFSKNQ